MAKRVVNRGIFRDKGIMNKYWVLLLLPAFLALNACRSSNSDSDGGDGNLVEQNPRDGAFTGFLWKPQSERNGNLVVLLPTGLRGSVGNGDVSLFNSFPPENVDLLETGSFDSDTENGARPDYRFSKPGAAYGRDIFVVADVAQSGTDSNATQRTRFYWYIANGAERVD